MTTKKGIEHSGRRNALRLGLGAASIATFTSATTAEAATPQNALRGEPNLYSDC